MSQSFADATVRLDPLPAIDACRVALANGSRSFKAASHLLPQAVRHPATGLYAFCREADDAIDLSIGAGGGRSALEWLTARLDAAYAGRPFDRAADRAFSAVVARHAIPRALPEALLEGFAWDAEGRRYQDLGALEAYAMRVAGTVGAMMAVIMGARGTHALARACDLGVAMQFTNIARDVGEDARAGRLYLPLGWLREAGIDPDRFLADPRFTPALGGVVKRLLAVADGLYARADRGIAMLPAGCRPGIRAARLLYAEIGAEVARQGHDSVSRRAVVPGWRKAAVLAQGLALPRAGIGEFHPPLASARPLVAAITATPARLPARRSALARADERAGWVIDLFMRLEQEGRGGGGMEAETTS